MTGPHAVVGPIAACCTCLVLTTSPALLSTLPAHPGGVWLRGGRCGAAAPTARRSTAPATRHIQHGVGADAEAAAATVIVVSTVSW